MSKNNEIEKVRQEIFKILDDGFYPYLRECDFTDILIKGIIAFKKRFPLNEIIEKIHENRKELYHSLKGTKPIDYSSYL